MLNQKICDERETPDEEFPAPPFGDRRFRNLLTHRDWLALPLPIRQRFSKRLSGGETALYAGEVVEVRLSRAGWLICQLARAIGGPLPLFADPHRAAIVTVTEDTAGGGQNWTRLYARRRGFPQIIHSTKRFAGPTGLEEYVGCGIGMALTVHIEAGALLFRSAFYFLQIGKARLRLPRWTVPGALTVTHAELGDGRFSFTLDIVHPLFGAVIRQVAIFRETLT